MLSQKEINRAAGIDHSAYGRARSLMFVAWHPIHGFGPINEIALREQYDHAKTDVKLLSHTGDALWKVVTVELKIAGADLSTAGASAPARTASAGKSAGRRTNAAGRAKT